MKSMTQYQTSRSKSQSARYTPGQISYLSNLRAQDIVDAYQLSGECTDMQAADIRSLRLFEFYVSPEGLLVAVYKAKATWAEDGEGEIDVTFFITATADGHYHGSF